jgi:hypothetical protein
MSKVRFAVLLPLVQTVLAAVFGGIGLWQRNEILSQPFMDGTLWQTTAAFHVWPWAFRFAFVSHAPAAVAGEILAIPIEAVWPSAPEPVLGLPSVILVAALWAWIGSRMDRKWRDPDASRAAATPWILLLVLTVVCLLGASFQLGHAGSVLNGAAVWIATLLCRDRWGAKKNQELPRIGSPRIGSDRDNRCRGAG